jgi:hypothetical protein
MAGERRGAERAEKRRDARKGEREREVREGEEGERERCEKVKRAKEEGGALGL